jgi:DNA-binding NarL/FixJ family response regulator
VYADQDTVGEGAGPGLTSAIRVLLVEDDPGFAALISALLVDVDVAIDLEVAGTLAAAIAALELEPADCVLLDLGLPDAQLDDTIRRVASVAGPTPVIVLSGHPDPELPDRVRRAGALDFVARGALDGPGWRG